MKLYFFYLINFLNMNWGVLSNMIGHKRTYKYSYIVVYYYYYF